MTCNKIKPLLSAYLEEELLEEKRRFVENHLDICGDCRMRLEGFQKVSKGLEELQMLPVPENFTQTVLEKIMTSAPLQEVRKNFILAAAAGVATLTIVVGRLLYNRSIPKKSSHA